MHRILLLKTEIEARYQNNKEELKPLQPSFEKDRRNKLIKYCNGFAKNASETITGKATDQRLVVRIEDVFLDLRESLLGTNPRREVETPRNRNIPARNQGVYTMHRHRLMTSSCHQYPRNSRFHS
jgi:hypothetical protein